ncbi:MAG: hypothetical protein LBU37_12325 [Tannerellaceae bacterium]|nr:hypothetical protein [Tannerellaceae bacterium]
MKMKMISIAFVAAIAVAAAWNFSQSSKAEVEFSDMALASGEGIKGCCPGGGACIISGVTLPGFILAKFNFALRIANSLYVTLLNGCNNRIN